MKHVSRLLDRFENSSSFADLPAHGLGRRRVNMNYAWNDVIGNHLGPDMGAEIIEGQATHDPACLEASKVGLTWG